MRIIRELCGVSLLSNGGNSEPIGVQTSGDDGWHYFTLEEATAIHQALGATIADTDATASEGGQPAT